VTDIPSEFVANRIFVTPRTADGKTLRLYTDSGGGRFITKSAVDRLGLDTEVVDTNEGEIAFVLLPELDDSAWIPGLGAPLPVLDTADATYGDGMLGAPWFADGAWTIDYPNERFIAGGEVPNDDHMIPLRVADGQSHATIDASILGSSRPFLFDTGATLQLEEGDRGTCFLIASLFDAWRDEHGWPVVDRADRGVEPVMEVPEVTIAGHTVGPVEFTRRADGNFHEWMAQWTDGPTDGALGGSLFRYFVVTADYPRGLVHFSR